MRAIVQLVSEASVTVDGRTTGTIKEGLVVLLGVEKDDTEKDADYLAKKIGHLRIFPDQKNLMNKSIFDVKGELLIVSQFTLLGDCRKGRRPSYSNAATSQEAKELYNYFVSQLSERGIPTQTGEFQAMMQLTLTNSGPVTIMLDSGKLF